MSATEAAEFSSAVEKSLSGCIEEWQLIPTVGILRAHIQSNQFLYL